MFPRERRILRATLLATSLLARTAQPAKTWQVSRPLVQPLRVGPYGGSPHTADPADAPRPVDTGLGQFVRTHLAERGDTRRVRVVSVTGQSSSWPVTLTTPALPASRSDYVDRNGRLQGRVGRPPRWLGGLWALVKSLCCLALDVWAWCRQHDIFLVASHLSGYKNFLADALPRANHRHPTEWTLHNAVTRPIFQRWPTSLVRVGEEPQTASVLLDPAVPFIERCEHADVELGMPLRICLSTDGNRPESIAEAEASTGGPDPIGSPVLAQPAVVPPVDVHVDGSAAGDLPEGRPPEERGHWDEVPQTGGDEVNCMASVRKSFIDRGFSANVADMAARARREWTRRVYGSCLGHYQRWCVYRGVDPVKAPLTEVAEFLETLLTIQHKGKPLAPSTFAGYRLAIVAIHQGFPDGSTVSSNTDLSTLLKGIFVVAARPRTLRETWDLPTLVRYLAGPPFEPLCAAPLKSVDIKMAFLIQLASARRVSWVHSCRIDPSHLRWENGGVRLLPSLLLDKDQSMSFTHNSVFLLSLKEHSPDDKVHCPLNALKWYLKLTKPLWGGGEGSFCYLERTIQESFQGYCRWLGKGGHLWGILALVAQAERAEWHSCSRHQRGCKHLGDHSRCAVCRDYGCCGLESPSDLCAFLLKDLPAMKERFSRAVMVAAGTAARKWFQILPQLMLNGGTLLPMRAGKDSLIKQEIRSNFSFMINTYL